MTEARKANAIRLERIYLSTIISSKKEISVRQLSQNIENIQSKRVPNLYKGKIWISDDFNDPLPDSFWLGEE